MEKRKEGGGGVKGGSTRRRLKEPGSKKGVLKQTQDHRNSAKPNHTQNASPSQS